MKIKHAKQHMGSLKDSVSFELTQEKWGNQTLVASLNGKEISRQVSLSSEQEINKAKNKIINQIKQYI